MMHGFGPLPQTPERDAQIQMRRRIVIVDAECRLVVRDGVVDRAIFEQQVSDVHDCRKYLRIGLGCIEEIGHRKGSFAELHARDAALVERERAHPIVRRFDDRRAERRDRRKWPISRERLVSNCVWPHGKRLPGEERPQVEERHHPMLHVHVVTLFPEMFAPAIGLSIVGRAVERELVRVTIHDLLDALGPSERADDRAYGGGPGMVLRIEPLARTLDGILAEAEPGERRRIVLTAASGPRFAQADAQAYCALDRLIVICGHYEGIDERLADLYDVEERSLGDFVLTGGEIPALAFVDATVRLIDDAIDAESRAAESFADGDALDHPAFTRPPRFRGVNVPAVLLSGDHAKIAEWRRQRSRDRAIKRRTDAEPAADADPQI